MANSRARSSREWVETYANRLTQLASAKADLRMSHARLWSFALNCARGGYPAFRDDDPAECAEAEFRDW